LDILRINGIIGEREPALESILLENGVGENFTAQMMRDYLSQNPKGPFTIEIKSIGGDVIQGFEIADMIDREKGKGREVTTIGMQYDSIASIIFLKGDKRKSVRGAVPLIHNSWLHPDQLGDTSLNAQTLREIADDNDEADFAMMVEYIAKAGRDNKRLIQDLMRNETQLTDKQLIDLNFATEIIAPITAIKHGKSLSYSSRALKAMAVQSVQEYSDVLAFRDGKVFLIQRSLDDDFEAGKFAFPGGKIEEGETSEGAALRELTEETGLTVTNPEHLCQIINDNGTISHYYAGQAEGDIKLSEDETETADFYGLEELKGLPIIMDGLKRYEDLILKTTEMSDELSAIKKAMNTLKALVIGGRKSMLLPLSGGAGELFVFSEDGEIEGKRAVLAEGGEPTEKPAPEGSHSLNDGRSITVGADGVIQSVTESTVDALAAMETEKDKMAADMVEKDKMMAVKDDEVKAAQLALKTFKAETETQLNALAASIKQLEAVVPGGGKPQTRQAVYLKSQEDIKDMLPSERRLASQIASRKHD